MKPVKAMIFAAGLGTRLRPLTDHQPKALVEVGGRPMIEHVLLRLKAFGIAEVVVNVHHFADKIKQFLSANNCYGLKCHIQDETEMLLDTGGALLAARKWLDNPTRSHFIIHNSDILTSAPLEEMVTTHIESGNTATLLVDDLRDSSRKLIFDINGRMKGWKNLSSGQVKPFDLEISSKMQLMAFGGIHIASTAIFEPLHHYATSARFSITDFYIDTCQKCKIGAYIKSADSYWYDLGTPQRLEQADKTLRK